MSKQSITILGATGSIGASTLAVLNLYPNDYHLFAVSGYSQIKKLFDVCQTFDPTYAVVPNQQAKTIEALINQHNKTSNKPITTQILTDDAGLDFVASHENVDIVMAAIVGSAGLQPTFSAIKAGKKVLLANKESLVMSGSLMMNAMTKFGAQILPVDSEHNAIFQCLPDDVMTTALTDGLSFSGLQQAGISHISLTASGGPFRLWTEAEIAKATPKDACKHPNWSMGQKISVDSATLMNKGLELIEACHLFSLPEDKIKVVIHPQSIVHSAVHYTDGSVLAQMGEPDMCTPIAHALAWPKRIKTQVKPLDLIAVAELNFYAPDTAKFPCLSLARQAMKVGQSAPAILNAANEVAVACFLQEKICFNDIATINEAMLSAVPAQGFSSIEEVIQIDQDIRQQTQTYIKQNYG